MGSVKTCDGRCHNATGSRCACWCAGLFHGQAGAQARDAFTSTFNLDEPPTTEHDFATALAQGDLFTGHHNGHTWTQALAAARTARQKGDPCTA
jgi:hypothetical protein